MTGTTFDGSSTNAVPPPEAVAWDPAAEAVPDTLLDQLRARVDERDQTEDREWTCEVPKVGIRLVCDPVIDNADFQRWMKSASTRAGRRRGATPGPMDLDQLQLSSRALVATCLRLEIKRDGDWTPMTGKDGGLLTLESPEVLRTFGVMDPVALLKKLFGRDARVIDSGQELLAAAGYLGGDEDEDPM